MRTEFQKWVNNLGLRILRTFAAEAKVGEGNQYVLEELLKGINKRNLHGEIRTGRPVGRELGSAPRESHGAK